MWQNFFSKKLISLFFLSLFVNWNLWAEEAEEKDNKKIAGITSLMQAVNNDDLSGVVFFIKTNDDEINKKNLGGATALHLASRSGNYEIAKILIEKGADLNIEDNEGWTPLMRASSFAYSDIIQLLVTSGAKIDKKNDSKESALIISAKSRCLDCVNIITNKFIEQGKDMAEELKKEIAEGFVIAKLQGNDELQSLFDQKIDQVNNLLDSKNLAQNSSEAIKENDKKVFSSDKIAKKINPDSKVITDHNQSEKDLAQNTKDSEVIKSKNVDGIIEDDKIIAKNLEEIEKENDEVESKKSFFGFLNIFKKKENAVDIAKAKNDVATDEVLSNAQLNDNEVDNDDQSKVAEKNSVKKDKDNKKPIFSFAKGKESVSKSVDNSNVGKEIVQQDYNKQSQEVAENQVNEIVEDNLNQNKPKIKKTGFFGLFAGKDNLNEADSKKKDDQELEFVNQSGGEVASDNINKNQDKDNVDEGIIAATINYFKKKDKDSTSSNIAKIDDQDDKKIEKIETNDKKLAKKYVVKDDKNESVNDKPKTLDTVNNKKELQKNAKQEENKVSDDSDEGLIKVLFNLFKNDDKEQIVDKDQSYKDFDNKDRKPESKRKFIFSSSKKSSSKPKVENNNDFMNDKEFLNWKNSAKPDVKEIERKFIFNSKK